MNKGVKMLSSVILLPFIGAPAGLLARLNPRHLSGWLMSLIPLSLFVVFCTQISLIVSGATRTEVYPWVPQMGIELIFHLDGLSLLYALLVSGIGTLVVLYSGYYLAGDAGLGRFYLALLIFMGSMLGLVLAGNVLTMFVFWELTSISSYLLVGYKHEYPEVRRGAQQGLIITVGGGLALLVGLLLLGEAANSYNFADMIAAGEELRASTLYAPGLILVFLGCFTKSAQFPFHFWLPNAMQAPTPASAYLHSATMVKAGIYLCARLYPALGETALWTYTLTAVGATTFLFGSVVALRKYDMKAVLAYSTVSWLGALTMLAGVGGHYAQKAIVVGIFAHALYKGALFLVAGIVDHEAGTRDLRKLGGLHKDMPVVTALAVLAALSMAGVPILFGFIAKEVLLKAVIESHLPDVARYAVLTLIVISAALGIAYSWRLIRSVFFGERRVDPQRHVHEAPFGMLLGPAVPASLSLLLCLGFLPMVSELLAPAAAAVAGEKVKVELALWEGINTALILSASAILLGLVLTRFERRLETTPSVLPGWLNADKIYDAAVSGMLNGAAAFTRVVQNGKMRSYITNSLLVLLAMVGMPFLLFGLNGLALPSFAGVRFYEVFAALLIPIGVFGAIRARSRLGAIISVGIVGAMVSLFFVLFSAPDLALTQLLVEVLSTVFLLLVFAVLPARFTYHSTRLSRVRDGIIASFVGLLMGGLAFVAATSTQFESIAPYFMAESLHKGKGANVVNVILVDFRGFDTMGEISVLFIAVVGIYGMLRLRERRGAEQQTTPAAHNGDYRSSKSLEHADVGDLQPQLTAKNLESNT
jgi:multicomponent Na+:H+ antiporter subunit A